MTEAENNKRMVWLHKSELHRANEQIVFMADPNDPRYTIVRCMQNVQPKNWRASLLSGVRCWKGGRKNERQHLSPFSS